MLTYTLVCLQYSFISMDLIGEFHPKSLAGDGYALTAICMLTDYTFCIPIKSEFASDIVRAYTDHFMLNLVGLLRYY